jgi:hypothetical protein
MSTHTPPHLARLSTLAVIALLAKSAHPLEKVTKSDRECEKQTSCTAAKRFGKPGHIARARIIDSAKTVARIKVQEQH